MNVLQKFESFIEKYGYEFFTLLLLELALASVIIGLSQIVLKIIISIDAGFIALLIGNKNLKKVFAKFGLSKLTNTITVLSFLLIGLWNWIIDVALIILLSIITLVKS